MNSPPLAQGHLISVMTTIIILLVVLWASSKFWFEIAVGLGYVQSCLRKIGLRYLKVCFKIFAGIS